MFIPLLDDKVPFGLFSVHLEGAVQGLVFRWLMTWMSLTLAYLFTGGSGWNSSGFWNMRIPFLKLLRKTCRWFQQIRCPTGFLEWGRYASYFRFGLVPRACLLPYRVQSWGFYPWILDTRKIYKKVGRHKIIENVMKVFSRGKCQNNDLWTWKIYPI